MLRRFLAWLNDLSIADPVERAQARILQWLLLGLMAVRLGLTLLDALAPGALPDFMGGPQGLILAAILFGILLTLRSGRLRTAATAIVVLAYLVLTRALSSEGIVTSGITAVGYVIPLAIAGLLLSRLVLALVAVLCIATVAVITLTSTATAGQPDGVIILVFTVFVTLIALLLERYRDTWERSIEAARANEERLRLALDAGAMGTWDWDLRSGRVIWGGHHANIMGLAEDTFDGRIESFSNLVAPADVAGLFSAVENARQQFSPYAHEYRVIWPDGSLHWVAGRGRFYPDRTGEAVRMIGVIADISARKSFEEQLTATIAERDALLARLQLILDRTPIGVFISDPDFLITYWNPAAEQLFGWSAAEMLGRRPDEQIMAAEVRARLPQIRQQIAASHTTLFVESQNLRKDGQVIVCAWSNTPLRDSDGAFLGFLAMVQDVTERHRREAHIHELNAELEQRVAARTAELAAKNRELEVFAYSVSHDLKAPLRGIDGYSRLLQEDFAGRLDGDGPYYIEMIRAATASMGQLIDDLLAYSRVERRALRVTGLALRPLVEQVAAEYADLLAEAGAQLSIDLPELSVLAEEEGLAQSLRNLVENAVKFSRDVAAPQIDIGGEAQGDTCLLWVRDNGIGFAMEYHDRIFDLFQRLHRAEEYPGTGIGLAIVRKAVERIGGAVWAESAPGAGATFYLRLPREPSEGL